jgi:hypothetical protein
MNAAPDTLRLSLGLLTLIARSLGYVIVVVVLVLA